MFIAIRRHHLRGIQVEKIINPVDQGNPMDLHFYQQETATALFRVWSKNVIGEFWDPRRSRVIPKRKWTPEMHDLYNQELNELPPVKGRFKITVIGYLFFLLAAIAMGMIIWDGIKPKGKSVIADNLDGQVKVGDIYFGDFAESKPSGADKRRGRAWFKIEKIQGDSIGIRLGTQTTKDYLVKSEALSNTSFEDTVYNTTIRGQKKYEIDFRTPKSVMSFWAREKK